MVDLAAIRYNEQRVIEISRVAESKLEMLFIDPLLQGRSIGRRLLRYAVDAMEARLVNINEQNLQAVRFCQRLGSQAIGQSEQDSMGKPFPLLHMR
jgi:putative acetyltransferase